MTEHFVDNTVSYTKASGLKVLAFFCVFMVCGVATILKFDTYFTDFWKIRQCNPEGYERNEFMFRCVGTDGEVIKADNYNSTKRSFSTDTIDSFFKERGLTYAILASEGAGYKSAILTMERMNLNPKILMVNHEVFYAKEITPAFREMVDFPDKYKTRFTFFYNAQKLQRFICKSKYEKLKNLYCNGKARARWRSVITSRENWNYIAPEKDQELIRPNPDARIFAADQLVERSRRVLEVRGYEETCPIWYIVNSESDFETWSRRPGVTVTDAAAEAPDGTMTADIFTIEKAGAPIQKVYKEMAIKAGTTMTFGGWFWSEDEMGIQLRLIKSCTRDTPMESFAKNFTLNEKPQRVSVSYTFKEDHGCALIRMVGLNPEKSFNGWRARADYQEAVTPTDTEETPLETVDE